MGRAPKSLSLILGVRGVVRSFVNTFVNTPRECRVMLRNLGVKTVKKRDLEQENGVQVVFPEQTVS